MLNPQQKRLRMGPRRRREHGFSLIEIVVTMAVLALILFAAVPSIGAWMDNTRIRNVADSLQNGLQMARGEAVRRNQSISLWLVAMDDPAVLSNDCALSSGSGSWVVSINSPIGHCADDPSTTSSPMLVTGRPAPDGGRVVVAALQYDASTAAPSVTIDGFGRVVNPDANRRIDVRGVTDGASHRNLRIDVSTGGQIRMCDPAVTADGDPRKC